LSKQENLTLVSYKLSLAFQVLYIACVLPLGLAWLVCWLKEGPAQCTDNESH